MSKKLLQLAKQMGRIDNDVAPETFVEKIMRESKDDMIKLDKQFKELQELIETVDNIPPLFPTLPDDGIDWSKTYTTHTIEIKEEYGNDCLVRNFTKQHPDVKVIGISCPCPLCTPRC